jgi:pheromone a factor receptor
VLAIYSFTSQRRRFQSLLQQSSSSLTTSRFFRLLAVSSTDMLFTVPFVISVIVQQSRTLMPSQKWSDLHYGFGQVFLYAKEDIADTGSASMEVTTSISSWLPLFAAFVYFACFGMHESALDKYAAAYCFVSGAFSKGCVQLGMAVGSPV